MNVKCLIRTMFLLLAGTAEPACADWQGARWNDSIDTVMKEFKFHPRLPSPFEVGGTALVSGWTADVVFDYKSGTLIFHGAMYFNQGKLARIHLHSYGAGSCDELLKNLNDAYGRPTGEGKNEYFLDAINHNRIGLFEYESLPGCTINYYPYYENKGNL